MGTEEKLFEDAYQSVTQPFEMEQPPIEAPAPDQGGDPGAVETPSVEGKFETPAPSGEKPQEAPGEYDLESFNKYFESDFKDVSSLKSVLSSSSKLTEYEKMIQDKENALKTAMEKSSKYDDLVDNLDPKKLYGDTEMYTYFKLKEKYPDKDPALLAQLRSASYDVLSDMDKLVLADKLKVKSNIPDSVRQKAIMQRIDIEADDLSEINDTDRYKLASAVSEHDAVINEIRSFIPEPLNLDLDKLKEARIKEIEARETNLKNSWEPLAKSLLKNYEKAVAFTRNEKGDFEESFAFAVDDKFKEGFMGSYIQSILDSGRDPTEENLKLAANHLDERFKILNFDRIVNAAIKHGSTLSEDVAHDLIHSDKPQNSAVSPPVNTEGKAMTLKERIQQRITEKRK